MKDSDTYREEEGLYCPQCESNDLEGGTLQLHGVEVHQKVNCNDCDAWWEDVYRLSGYTRFVQGDTE